MDNFILHPEDITADDLTVIYSYLNKRQRKFNNTEVRLCRRKITLSSLLKARERVNRVLSRVRTS